MIKLKKGLDLPIAGKPSHEISEAKVPSEVAVVGTDFIGMKPTFRVAVGDTVKIGQILFACKKNEGVVYTSPANGKIKAINRGARRVLESVVISNEGNEHQSFSSYKGHDLSSYNSDELVNLLVESGSWVSLKTRPFDKVAGIKEEVSSLFVTAMDTNPLSPCAHTILKDADNAKSFSKGLEVLAKVMGSKKVHVCTNPLFNFSLPSLSNIEHSKFEGVHPAGNAGTHIHHLDPVSSKNSVWHINYQDVISIGKIFFSGELDVKKYVSFAGPCVKKPQIYKVRKGLKISEVFPTEFVDSQSELRTISGSVFNGRTASAHFDYLGHFSSQVTVLEEGRTREFLGWQKPGANKFSVTKAFLSAFLPKKQYNFTTTNHGSHRALLPIGSYEKVMPMDILPTFLLRSLMGGDAELAQKLGVLELVEEDLALCTFVDAGKTEFGPVLRNMLETIERDG